MRVIDLMTIEVETAAPEDSLKEAARRMVRRGVSGLPVLDADGLLVGIITEADFLAREADRSETQGRRRLLDALFSDREPEPDENTVGSTMTVRPTVIYPEASLTEAARVMVAQGVKRLPVVDEDGKLIGVISRADVVNAFTRPDDVIEEEIRQDVLKRVLFVDPDTVGVAVDDGIVTLTGTLPSRSDVRLFEELTRRLDGVVRVENETEYEVDDERPLVT